VKKERGTHPFWFQGSKEKVRPAFQNFGVQGFAVFIAKNPTYNNSQNGEKKRKWN
jgi:hypothetical protein